MLIGDVDGGKGMEGYKRKITERICMGKTGGEKKE